MTSFGILGNGQFGSRIQEAVQELGAIRWAANSSVDFTTLEVPDWVFVATPNALHFEQAAYFLRAGAHVFLEKPATLHPQALRDLIAMAIEAKRHLYIDDVFLHRSDLAAPTAAGGRFVWHKAASNTGACLLDRLAYHHLYLILDALGGSAPPVEVLGCTSNSPTRLEFDCAIGGRRFSFSYDVSDETVDRHEVWGAPVGAAPGNPLARMLARVVSGEADFEGNQRYALWVTEQIARVKRACFPNVAVVGGGIFGCTIAVELASHGYQVVLFERHSALMAEASSINQYRVHNGYHYPRSWETAQECRVSASGFIRAYRQALVPKSACIAHRYAISSRDSLTTAEQFLCFMSDIGLPFTQVEPLPGTDVTVEVMEDLFDPTALAHIAAQRLHGAGVEVRLGHEAREEDLQPFHYSVVATYANLNDLCTPKREFQFELCEKPVLKLPEAYRRKSIVVMDGPFMCIDPLGNTGYHVMGNVVHAIHHRNIGFAPEVPPGYDELLNRGVVRNPPITNIAKFLESARQFFPGIEAAEHIGSMFTFRTVQPNQEHDDARPTLVEWVSPTRMMVFSGKICTSVSASQRVASDLALRISSLTGQS